MNKNLGGPPKGMIVGAKAFVSLPNQQSQIAGQLTKGNELPSAKENKQARDILNDKIQNYEIKPQDVYGAQHGDDSDLAGAAFSTIASGIGAQTANRATAGTAQPK